MTQRVLIVEDDDMCALLVESQLRRCNEKGYEVLRASTLREALAILHNEHVDLCLLDLELPDSTGLQSIPKLKEAAGHVPIVVLTANEDEELPLQAVEHGAQEFISKDMVVGKLLLRAIRLSVARQKQLVKAQAEALIDPLTGLANRRALDLELDRLAMNSARSSLCYCVAMVDIDYFKRINDNWGHEVGDRALVQVARVLESSIRQVDTVSRYGGEEFGITLPGARLENAVAVMERIRRDTAALQCDADGSPFSITVSIGVAQYEGADSRNLLADADRALYLAKSEGRNCVRVAQGQLV